MIKIIIVKGKTPEERANKIEEVQNLNPNIICKGSIYYKSNKEFYADIYLQKGETKINNPPLQDKEKVAGSTTPAKSPLKEFIPSKEDIERWANIKPSVSQLFALRKLGYDGKKPETMLEAYKIRKEYEDSQKEFKK